MEKLAADIVNRRQKSSAFISRPAEKRPIGDFTMLAIAKRVGDVAERPKRLVAQGQSMQLDKQLRWRWDEEQGSRDDGERKTAVPTLMLRVAGSQCKQTAKEEEEGYEER
ncbi:hypothetical protein Dda_7347 [Drechslerella dactyloides]|uniref:Uncharacterized protein n=1 Tax=Drechslerella dactyloides TaxID=74499 RepID=A0AAD6IWB1_DREDA|nr:hypothetical protein Dda_7347 [Drechslerella dactyloides]